jgi:alkaline phosphatase D
MTLLDRRVILKAGTLGLGALALPGLATALSAARGFTNNVASGEPGQRKVMLWTRFVPAGGGSARLDGEVSETPDFRRIVAGGSVTARPGRDHCARLVVSGLLPGRCYYYRFVGPGGARSPVGRTRTLPEGHVERFRMGIFSCSNLGFGWFNAYAHAAARADIDLMVHLGDYYYEYRRGDYPGPGEAVAGRWVEPAGELIHLADYRLRFAAYRSDPDLQALHARFPMVAMWDDHESANDSWQGGAENHQPETEGPWQARKRASVRAYREWMPVGDETWGSYEIGALATLFRPETRLTGRTHQLDLAGATAAKADLRAALIAFRDGPWRDPARSLMGPRQEQWLAQALARSVRQGTRWQVLAQQVVMGSIGIGPKVAEWGRAAESEGTRDYMARGLAAYSVGLPLGYDQWDGYPAARERLLRASLDAGANLVVLSGDSHNAWAFDLDLRGVPAGVEFAGHSVTSPGYEVDLPAVRPEDLARATVEENPQLRWAELSRRGYLTVELTPDRATGEWLFLDTIRSRSTRLAGRHAIGAKWGAHRLSA